MSDPDKPSRPPRPPRVTFAVVLGAVGCVVLIGSLFDTLSRLRGSEMRESLADMLADPPLQGSGITVEQMVSVMRVIGFAAGALAAAGVVLAVFVAQQHRGARIGYTVVAVLLLLTVPTTGLLPIMPAVAAAMMWSREARAWYAGETLEPARRDPSPRPEPGGWTPPRDSQSPPPSESQPQSEPQSGPRSQPPPAANPFASPAAPPYAPTGQGGDPYGSPQPYAQQDQPTQPYAEQPAQLAQPTAPQTWAPSPVPERRPGTVTTAAVLALIGSGLGLLGGGAILAALLAAPSVIEEALRNEPELEQAGLTLAQLEAVLWGAGAVMVLWSLVSTVLAVLTLRRLAVARVLLALSAGAAAVFSLLAILSGIAVVTLLLAAATVVLLFTGGANDWFARRPPRARTQPPAGGFSGSAPPW